MNYIIFDLELNSKAFKSKLPNEVVEIGAVKLDDSLDVTDSFQAFVKPKVFRKLFPVIKRKTNISQSDINNAEGFRVVLERFKAWIGNEEFVLCTWGHDDIHHLKANCQFNRVGSKWIRRSVDIQKYFSKLYEAPLGQRYSLNKALSLLEIPVDEELHRADVDARYTTEVFQRVFGYIKSQGAI